jgi:hypothetical protein
VNERRVDPEPITIFLAIMAGVSGTIAAANYVRTHHLKPVQSSVRAKILELLAKLEDQSRELRGNVGTLRDIFSSSTFSQGGSIRVGNGAYLTPANYSRYKAVSENVYRQLQDVNRITNKLEEQTSRHADLETRATSNMLGDAYGRLDRLIAARDLSSEQGWGELDALIALVERAISELRRQLEQE